MSLDEHFENWWKHYPRKEGKQKAREKYKKAVSALKKEGRGGVLYLSDRVQKFAECVKKWPAIDHKGTRLKPHMIPHPATWLNQGRYDDDEKMWLKHVPLSSLERKAASSPSIETEEVATPEERRQIFQEWRQKRTEQTA